MVRAWCSHCCGPGSIPGLGTNMLQAMQCGQKKIGGIITESRFWVCQGLQGKGLPVFPEVAPWIIVNCAHFLFFFIIYLFIYFWLSWVFVAAHVLSLVVVSGGYSSLWCAGFSL